MKPTPEELRDLKGRMRAKGMGADRRRGSARPWRYVDHPETGDMVPANTHAEVAAIAAALRATGLCAANVWETDADPEGKDDAEAMRLLRGARPTGEAVLASGTLIRA